MSRINEQVGDEIPDYDSSGEIICAICSHDGCPHYHSTQKRLSKREVQAFMRWRESTLLTKHSRGDMPGSITSYPLEFDVHCIAALKYDDVIMGPHYDRDLHLARVPLARAKRESKRAAKHSKLSEAAKRRRKQPSSQAPRKRHG